MALTIRPLTADDDLAELGRIVLASYTGLDGHPADASTCAVLPAAVAAPLFEDATTLTFFTDAGVTYAVTPVQQLPGRTC